MGNVPDTDKMFHLQEKDCPKKHTQQTQIAVSPLGCDQQGPLEAQTALPALNHMAGECEGH